MTALEQYIADVKAATQGEPMKVALMGVASEVQKQSIAVEGQIATVGAAATTATEKAAAAAASADDAADSEVIATTKAGIATTQAGIATTKATEAAASKTAAETAKGIAVTAKNDTVIAKTAAQLAETNSKASEVAAEASKVAAAGSAGVATTKAGESAASAAAALASEQAAALRKSETQAIKDAAVLALAETTDEAEVIEARKGKSSLGEKISEIDSQLAEKAKTTDVNAKFGSMGNTKTFKGSCTNAVLLTKTGMLVDDYWYVSDLTTNKCWNGSAWIDIGNVLKIGDASIESKSLNFTTVECTKGKNLFDKSKAIMGYYVSEGNGTLISNVEFFSTPFIPVLPNTQYVTQSNRMAFFNLDKQFISAVMSATTFTTPANCYFLRTCNTIASLARFQIELGNIATGYESGLPTILREQVKGIGSDNIIYVSKNNGDYDTINAALSAAKDSSTKPVTIFIAPGIYVESVKLIGRYITLIGTNKETCIIRTYTNDYYYPPIDLSANSNLYNLTIVADDNGTTTPPLGVNNLPAYAIHHDISSREGGYNASALQGIARVKNCIFESKHQHAAGVGLAQNQHLIFEDCEFIAHANPAFRAHNYIGAGATRQKMTVKNCTMHNAGTIEPIVLQDPNNAVGGKDNVDTVFTFINNVSWNETNGHVNNLSVHTPLVAGAVSGKILLGKGSFGNSIAQLNA